MSDSLVSDEISNNPFVQGLKESPKKLKAVALRKWTCSDAVLITDELGNAWDRQQNA